MKSNNLRKQKIFNSKTDILYFLISVIFIGFIIFLLIKVFNISILALKKLADKYPAILVALITGFLAFLSVPVGKYFENKFTIDNKIRETKEEIYTEFLEWLIDNILYTEISKNKRAVEDLKKKQKNITIYASDKVLKSWAEFKEIAMKSEGNKVGMSNEEQTQYYITNEAPYIENLILSMRKELGYKNKNIKKYDVLRLYINDIDKYL